MKDMLRSYERLLAAGFTPEHAVIALGLRPIAGGSTMIHDFKNNVIMGQSLANQARTSSANGTGIDMQAGEDQAFAIVDVNTVSDGTHTITFQESKNNNVADATGAADPYAAVVAADANAALVSNVPQVLNIKRSKRYLRAVTTVSGTTTGANYGVLLGTQKKFY